MFVLLDFKLIFANVLWNLLFIVNILLRAETLQFALRTAVYQFQCWDHVSSGPMLFLHCLFLSPPRVGLGHPSSPLSIYFLIFFPFTFFFLLLALPIFLLLSILSLSTRIVSLRFQAGGRRRRPNLGLVFFCSLCYLYSLVKMDCAVLFYLVSFLCVFLQCFDTVGWVIWPVKTGPRYDL